MTRGHITVLAVLVLGCGGPPDEPDAGTTAARQREVLGALARDVILVGYAELERAALALVTATEAYAADPTDPNRAAAQQAWRDAIGAWQPLEVVQIGPAAMPAVTGAAVGARGLRDEIYSWPATGLCRIDQEIVEDVFGDPDAFASELVNVRGLDAMEYLLFTDSPDNRCAALSTINMDGSWNALGEVEVRRRRAEYAASLAVLVARSATALRAAWDPAEGNFAGELASAGDGSTVYETARRAMNDLGGAILYVDGEVKGMKLGEPAGIEGCATATCLESLESKFASIGVRHIRDNLVGLERVFLGGPPGEDALGIDDLLIDLGATALRDAFAAALADAIAAFDALVDPSLRRAIETEPATVMVLYERVAEIVRLIKADLETVLDLEPTVRISDDD